MTVQNVKKTAPPYDMVYSTASEANAIPLYAKAAVNTKKKIPPALLTEMGFVKDFFCK